MTTFLSKTKKLLGSAFIFASIASNHKNTGCNSFPTGFFGFQMTCYCFHTQRKRLPFVFLQLPTA